MYLGLPPRRLPRKLRLGKGSAVAGHGRGQNDEAAPQASHIHR